VPFAEIPVFLLRRLRLFAANHSVPQPVVAIKGAALMDMDAELAALELRRQKNCDLKQAMMPELLTGKTRLL